MACRSGCKTQDHLNWGECLRDAGITVTPVDGQAKKIDHELQSYHDARRQGIQPAGTSLAQTQAAVAASNKVGHAFDGAEGVFTKKDLRPKGKKKKTEGGVA